MKPDMIILDEYKSSLSVLNCLTLKFFKRLSPLFCSETWQRPWYGHGGLQLLQFLGPLGPLEPAL